LGRPHLDEVLAEHVQNVARQGRHALALLPYHFMSEFAADVIRAEFPRLAEKMQARTAVFAWENRAMEMIDSREAYAPGQYIQVLKGVLPNASKYFCHR
jgi:hypothetical protein